MHKCLGETTTRLLKKNLWFFIYHNAIHVLCTLRLNLLKIKLFLGLEGLSVLYVTGENISVKGNKMDMKNEAMPNKVFAILYIFCWHTYIWYRLPYVFLITVHKWFSKLTEMWYRCLYQFTCILTWNKNIHVCWLLQVHRSIKFPYQRSCPCDVNVTSVEIMMLFASVLSCHLRTNILGCYPRSHVIYVSWSYNTFLRVKLL